MTHTHGCPDCGNAENCNVPACEIVTVGREGPSAIKPAGVPVLCESCARKRASRPGPRRILDLPD